MADSVKFLIKNDGDVDQQFLEAWKTVKKGLQGGDVEITLGRPGKSRAQEEKYHAMIGDFAKTVELDGKKFSPDVWKALLVDSFQYEKDALNEPLTHPGTVVISLDGRRAVTVRATTTKFRKSEASDFVEYLYKMGAEYKAVFSDHSMAVFEEYGLLAAKDSNQ